MAIPSKPLPAPLAALQEQYPTWSIWIDGAGHPYATRHGRLTAYEMRAGLVMTLSPDDKAPDLAADLAALLAAQIAIEIKNDFTPRRIA